MTIEETNAHSLVTPSSLNLLRSSCRLSMSKSPATVQASSIPIMRFQYQKKGLETQNEFRVPKERDSKLIMSFEYQKKYQKKGLETHYENGLAACAGALQGHRRYCTVDMYSILIMSFEYQKMGFKTHNEFGVPKKWDSKLIMSLEYQKKGLETHYEFRVPKKGTRDS